MKKIYMPVALLLAFALLLTGCQQVGAAQESVPEESDNRLRVVATIFPQYDFVRQIAGDKVDLTMLLPPGSECHSYEPTPQDILRIQNADLFIYGGGATDDWVVNVLEDPACSGVTALSLLDMVDAVPEEIVEGMEHDHEEEDEEHDDHELELDEHVWTSPLNAKIIVQAIGNSLGALDKDNAQEYAQNTVDYMKKLDELHADFLDVVGSASRKTLVFGDRFPFRYLADSYGLDYAAAFSGCSTQTEASAATVAYLIDTVEAEAIPVVFHIEFSNGKMADTICESTGAKKLMLHSCHNISKSDMERGVTYLDLMNSNLDNLKEALN